MIDVWRGWAPGVAIQIPPNLESRWEELLGELDDLGGISCARDEVNPNRPWERVEYYERRCMNQGRMLQERLPVYESHCTEEWLTDRWMEKVRKFRERKR